MELARAEGVGAEALGIEDGPQRQRQVGLERRQERCRPVGPAGRERRPDAAGVAPQLVFRDDVERRAEPAGELDRVALLDPQVLLPSVVEPGLSRIAPGRADAFEPLHDLGDLSEVSELARDVQYVVALVA